MGARKLQHWWLRNKPDQQGWAWAEVAVRLLSPNDPDAALRVRRRSGVCIAVAWTAVTAAFSKAWLSLDVTKSCVRKLTRWQLSNWRICLEKALSTIVSR
jgi:hypothetical protein